MRARIQNPRSIQISRQLDEFVEGAWGEHSANSRPKIHLSRFIHNFATQDHFYPQVLHLFRQLYLELSSDFIAILKAFIL